MTRVALFAALGLAAVIGAAGWFYLAGTPWQSALTNVSVTPDHGIRMEKFALRNTERDETRWEILADAAEMNPRVNTTTLEGVHLTLFSAKHGQVQVTAHRGVIQNESKDIQVCGDVRLVMGDEFALTTECLQWSALEQALATDAPVSIAMGTLRVEGQGFRGWIADERFEVREQVMARWSEP